MATKKKNTSLKKKKFQKCKENFICENCRTFVFGDGYRNHCPACLYSKHVDINPGDRRAKCHGLMKVVDIKLSHGNLILTHCCLKCGYEHPNRAHAEDSTDIIILLMQRDCRRMRF